MSFARPSLQTLIARVQQQIGVNLPGLTPQLRRSVVQIMGQILAMELYQEYAYIDNFVNWFFVATATGIYLDRKGEPIGVPREPGGAAQLGVSFTGIGTYPIGQNAVLQSQDGSLTFTLNATVTLAGAPATAAGVVTAQQLGSASSLAAGTVLTLVQAVAGVNAAVTVTGVTVPGVDVETDDAYRTRILARQQLAPQGGCGLDYVAWAKLTPGVTRAWTYPLYAGPGTVGVAPVFDGRANILPLSADITAIQAVIAPLQPVDANVSIITLAIDTINVVISNLVPASGYTKAQALANAEADLILLFAGTTPGGASWGDGVVYELTGSTSGTLPLEDISDAITQSAGVASFDLTSPTADIVSANGHIARIGTVTAP